MYSAHPTGEARRSAKFARTSHLAAGVILYNSIHCSAQPGRSAARAPASTHQAS